MRDRTDPPYPRPEIEKQREQLRKDLQEQLEKVNQIEDLYLTLTITENMFTTNLATAIDKLQWYLKRELDLTHEYEPKELI